MTVRLVVKMFETKRLVVMIVFPLNTSLIMFDTYKLVKNALLAKMFVNT